MKKMEVAMPLSGDAFVKEIQELVRNKHSKDRPVIGMIEREELTRNPLCAGWRNGH